MGRKNSTFRWKERQSRLRVKLLRIVYTNFRSVSLYIFCKSWDQEMWGAVNGREKEVFFLWVLTWKLVRIAGFSLFLLRNLRQRRCHNSEKMWRERRKEIYREKALIFAEIVDCWCQCYSYYFGWRINISMINKRNETRRVFVIANGSWRNSKQKFPFSREFYHQLKIPTLNASFLCFPFSLLKITDWLELKLQTCATDSCRAASNSVSHQAQRATGAGWATEDRQIGREGWAD